MHQFEGDVSNQFSAHRAEVQFNAGDIGNDKTGGVISLCNDGGRSQVDFLVLYQNCMPLYGGLFY